MSEWGTIDSAPKDGTSVLVSGPSWNDPEKEPFVTIAYHDDERGGWSEDGDPIYEPTHWMPLPPPLGASS